MDTGKINYKLWKFFVKMLVDSSITLPALAQAELRQGDD